MTDKAKDLLSTTVYIQAQNISGYESNETFSSAGTRQSLTDVDKHAVAEVNLANAVDELHRMLLIAGWRPDEIRHRMNLVITQVLGDSDGK